MDAVLGVVGAQLSSAERRALAEDLFADARGGWDLAFPKEGWGVLEATDKSQKIQALRECMDVLRRALAAT